MKVGIISDTHDNLPKIKSAVEMFKKEGVEFVIHAGDIVAPFSLIPFLNMGIEWKAVFGNNDGERKGLAKKSEGRVVEQPLELTLGGKTFVVVHEPENIREEYYSKFDVIVYGHTHQKEINRRGRALIVNPGEGCGYLTGTATLVVLDTDSLDARFLEID